MLFALFATVWQVGNLSVPRAGHTAVLQSDGRVVVMGGTDTRTIEWIDLRPRSRSIDAVADATPVPLDSHAAAILDDDRILLTGGGFTGDRTTMTGTWGNRRADLYDPIRGEVVPIGTMNDARQSHEATRLADGGVLITGGATISKTSFIVQTFVTYRAEIFDPATGAFRPVGPMRSTRYGHTATLLPDGRVLIAGGSANRPFPQWSEPLASTEIFDPRTETFEPGPGMMTKRIGHTATLLDDGRVVIAGGRAWPIDPATGSTEIFDFRTNTLTAGPDIGTRAGHTATRLPSGRVLFFGGADDAVLYDFRTGALIERTPLAIGRSDHAATLLEDGTVLITGGVLDSIRLRDILVYGPTPPRRRSVR